MSDLLVIFIIVAVFGFGIGIVRVLGAMIDRDSDPDGLEDEE
jgi:hypothetical protein